MLRETMDIFPNSKTPAEKKLPKEVTLRSKTAKLQLVCKLIWRTIQMAIMSNRRPVTSLSD
jgi:hypothetical protein